MIQTSISPSQTDPPTGHLTSHVIFWRKLTKNKLGTTDRAVLGATPRVFVVVFDPLELPKKAAT
jgi:hypothetical protein